MEKKAIISIVSNASMEDGDVIEVVSPGKYIKMDSGYKAVYEETEISGMEGTTTMREGTTSTKMLFNEKEPSVSLYNTPYGMMEITINTKKLNVEVNDNGGNIKIDYDMAIAGQEVLTTSLSLNVRANK
ncbi:DUF1934 domain-containing protein [Clostridium sp.]|uniref:DUF1934 domain-containing protein n=1 Tax=Clostridium sp. TaxID=1506 RepID=UPI002914C466|nr:DUF1934 domain-containing protein [Clostridium sp.]MDU3355376.1 DUF1934 domain-containing protein [Clostridium sp.]